MKPLILSIVMLVSITAFSQSDKYTQAMQKDLAMLDAAKTAADLNAAAAAFERVGDAEKTQWLPYYWAALAKVRVGWIDKSVDKDKLAAEVKALCAKGEAINDNAEFASIRNMAATQQMLVNPQERWQTYGQEAAAALQKGMQLDANNPRLYYLQGMSVFNTPEQFGGGKEKAKPIFQKAVDLYKVEEKKPLYPTWGADLADSMLAKCQ
ncbi:hypothetical protein FC093_11855 [Ilyomonas limi]|uniref:Tetratricopeptide repeat protein n=1 Tax=Ilyomonas limi TaxID=2575867 RepID=A0A4U3L0H4_9BACT|nr:hypothetical protein [Ilyomonas limi]TKK68320.1 hypothetical protein FC093_11855 [Ilyomonas limi]